MRVAAFDDSRNHIELTPYRRRVVEKIRKNLQCDERVAAHRLAEENPQLLSSPAKALIARDLKNLQCDERIATHRLAAENPELLSSPARALAARDRRNLSKGGGRKKKIRVQSVFQ
jgi:hypothetical protein